MVYHKGFASGKFLKIVEEYSRDWPEIVVDACFVSKSSQEALRFALPHSNIEWHYFNTSVDECIARQDNRERKVPASVIRNMNEQLSIPKNAIIHDSTISSN